MFLVLAIADKSGENRCVCLRGLTFSNQSAPEASRALCREVARVRQSAPEASKALRREAEKRLAGGTLAKGGNPEAARAADRRDGA